MASFLVTGASRGFGLALIRELVSHPASKVGTVFAAARGSAPALDEIAKSSSGRVSVVKLDVGDQASITKAAEQVETKLGGKGLDVLINNAGICHYAFEGVKSMCAFSLLSFPFFFCFLKKRFFPLLSRVSVAIPLPLVNHHMHRDKLEESFTINVMAVHWVTSVFLPLLQKGTLKKVINV